MEKISINQLRCIKAMVGKLGIQDADAIVQGYTAFRTGHVSEMTMDEARMMIKHLKSQDPDEEKAERMRRKLLGMAYKVAGLGARATKDEKLQAKKDLNGWCLAYGHVKRELDDYTVKELPKLVTQYEKRVQSLLKSI